MRKKFLKSIHSSVCLGLLTLFLVTTVVPVLAQSPDRKLGTGNWGLGIRSALLARGRNLYEVGQFYEAAAVWQEAALGFERQGDKVGQARSLNYLSLAYQALGEWEQAKSAIDRSLHILQQPEQMGEEAILAQALNTQGQLQNAIGQTDAALKSWQQAEDAYKETKDEVGILGSQINQAQALQALGLYRRSRTLLLSVKARLQAQPNSLLKVKGLQSLGVVLQVIGDLQQSREVLEESLPIAQSLDAPVETSDILFSLGNTARDLQEPETALDYYQQAVTTTTSPQIQIEAQLNQLSLHVNLKEWQSAIALLAPIESNLANLPRSRMSVYAAVNFAQSLEKLAASSLENGQKTSSIPLKKAAQVLASALKQAKSIKDSRAEAYALTQLGSLYEQTAQSSEALTLTKNALQIAQGINASDIAAHASWQLGRLLKQTGDTSSAIAAYTEAVNTLKSLRNDLVAINADVQFSFQESVEPVYRELVGLLLQSNPSQKQLGQAREVIESLQQAELENFFREACLNALPKQIDEVDQKAAVIYPIILADRLEVILSLPGQPLLSYTTSLPQRDVESTLDQLLQSLNPAFSSQERLRLSQQVYNWLIRPAQDDLASNKVETLVFVLDGFLRNLPMAALHDGKQYLVEKYSIALTPGLQLVEPQSLKQKQLKALVAGMSEASQGFSALPGVEFELDEIASRVPSELLLNQEFTSISLQDEIKQTPFPVIHLATHGQFSSNPDETFFLTWNGKINVNEFKNLLSSKQQGESSSIELLVLSACQTAAGDKRAALGLAGMAVRSGARSTLATLWSVKDESTALLMAQFYRELAQLQPKVSKAEVLRQAQLALIKSPQYKHPFYWAPFILVGNWL